MLIKQMIKDIWILQKYAQLTGQNYSCKILKELSCIKFILLKTVNTYMGNVLNIEVIKFI